MQSCTNDMAKSEMRKKSCDDILKNDQTCIPFSCEPNGRRFNVFESNLSYICDNYGSNIELVTREGGSGGGDTSASRIRTVGSETDAISTTDIGINTDKSSLSNQEQHAQTRGSSIWPIAVPIPFFLFYNNDSPDPSTSSESCHSTS